jgi:hypothetical protein
MDDGKWGNGVRKSPIKTEGKQEDGRKPETKDG